MATRRSGECATTAELSTRLHKAEAGEGERVGGGRNRRRRGKLMRYGGYQQRYIKIARDEGRTAKTGFD
ncbi:hypothetical protein Dda_3960 [Drechslerella dactyloides]|uniref:Uncharacterized protein n=1 Tax=Drechslerella dactyloides TaxID=74499 RepID=A0AAD6IZB5_DREDA|nr:hypothetical protein Dda_3960 [Drechslerella dactyloides]